MDYRRRASTPALPSPGCKPRNWTDWQFSDDGAREREFPQSLQGSFAFEILLALLRVALQVMRILGDCQTCGFSVAYGQGGELARLCGDRSGEPETRKVPQGTGAKLIGLRGRCSIADRLAGVDD
jgi:hypothetical protein